MGRVTTNFIYSVIAIGITACAGLFSIPVLTRKLTPYFFGHISLLLIFFNIFAILDGLRPVIVNYMHSSSKSRQDIIRTCFVFSWINGLVFASATFGVLIFIYKDTFSLTEIIFLSFAAFFYFPMTNEAGFLEAAERVGFTSLARAVVWAFLYISFICYSLFSLSPEYYAMSLFVMNGLLFLIYFYAGKDRSTGGGFKKNIIMDMGKGIKQVFFFNIYVAIMNFSDRLFISRFLPLNLLGYYSVQYELGTKGNILVAMISRVLYPTFCKKITKEPRARVLSEWARITKFVFFMVFICTLVAFLWSDIIIALYAGKQYAAYSHVLKIIMVGIAVNSLGFMATFLQRADGDFKSQEKAYFKGALLAILAVYPLIANFGLSGAALVYLFARSADVFLIFNIKKRYFPDFPLQKIFIWPGLFFLCYAMLFYRQYMVFAVFFILFIISVFTLEDIFFIKRSLAGAKKR